MVASHLNFLVILYFPARKMMSVETQKKRLVWFFVLNLNSKDRFAWLFGVNAFGYPISFINSSI